METPIGQRCVMYATWRSPLLWWPIHTTRAKFMPRTWDWRPSVPRPQVCTGLFLLFLKPPAPNLLFLFVSIPLKYLNVIYILSFKCHYFSLTVTVAAQTPAAAQQKKKPGDDSSSTLSTGSNNNNNNNNPDRFCSICQASFNNPLMAQQHYMGKKHRKQMTKLKLMETYGPSTTPGQTPQPGTHEPARPSRRTPLSK